MVEETRHPVPRDTRKRVPPLSESLLQGFFFRTLYDEGGANALYI